MAQTATQAGFSREAFEAFLATRDEPSWLVEARKQAFEIFEQLPLPTTQQEEWRRTDIRTLRLDRFGPVAEGEPLSGEIPTALLAEGVDLGGRTVAVNSRPAGTELSEDLARQGVLFGSLDELLPKHEAVLRPHYGKAVAADYDKFSALNAAFWSGGTLLYVPRGVTIEQPLHTLSVLTAGGTDLSRTLVILEDGAHATLLGETVGEADPALHCGTIELLVGPRANLRYVNLQNWGNRVWHFAHQNALVDQDAQLQWTIGALGSRLAKVNQHVELVGPGARAQVNGVMFTEGRQHLCYNTRQRHRAHDCTSDLLYKGALQDHSRVVWRGMIAVDPGAQKTNAYQRNDNLILSTGSRADSIPGLEILADDVVCTHGATAGHVDEDQVFYARCRGLTRNEAIRTIVAGFFQKVFDRIPIESVRDALGEAIRRRIRDFQ